MWEIVLCLATLYFHSLRLVIEVCCPHPFPPSPCQIDSPSAAKKSTVEGTLANIVKHFASTWADPTSAATADGRKVLSFLINLVSCVSVLPPESVPIFPHLDSRLLPAFGRLCVAESELRRTYQGVAIMASRAILEAMTMKTLFGLAEEVHVDVDNCTSKDQVVENLLISDKSLEPTRNAATDRDALMMLYGATYGPSWKDETGWGEVETPIGDWYGVTVDDEGRVIGLNLVDNDLKGA